MRLVLSLLALVTALAPAAPAGAADSPISQFHLAANGAVTTKVKLKAGTDYPMEIIGTSRRDIGDGTDRVSLNDAFYCYDAEGFPDCPPKAKVPGHAVPITARTAETTTLHPLQEFVSDGEEVALAFKPLVPLRHPPYASNHSYGFTFRPKLTGTLVLATSEVCGRPTKCTGEGYDVKIFEPGASKDPCEPDKTAQASAVNEVRVVAVAQEVDYHRAGAPVDDWRPVCKDTVLQQGDEISCDPDGAVTLQFADNSTVVVRNTTQLKIASFFTEGGVVRTEIELKMGEIRAKVNRSNDAAKSDFRIKSPTGTASVRGTEFSVFYDPLAKAGLTTVHEGVVDVAPANTALAPLSLTAGQEVEVTSTSVSAVSGIGKAGARGGLTRRDALGRVVAKIAKANGPCGVHTPRSNAFAVRPAPSGWAVDVKLLGKRHGTSSWRVKNGKVSPANKLAKKLAKGCR